MERGWVGFRKGGEKGGGEKEEGKRGGGKRLKSVLSCTITSSALYFSLTRS